MITYKAKGKLIYYPSWWLVLYTDNEICKYYRSLMFLEFKHLKINAPKHEAHISIIYGDREEPLNKHFWGKYKDEEIDISYDPFIIQDREYFYMRVYCTRIEDIRVELGLPPNHEDTPWHITIGNTK